MSRWIGLAPVAALAVTGCMASKSDILLLQDEVRTLRAMQARSDTVRRAQADSTLMMSVRANDSLRALSQRFGAFQANVGAFQANVGGELFEIGRQLIQLQEKAGMSSKQIMDLRSSLDERTQAMAAAGTSETASAPPAPGPAQLFTASFDLLRRTSYGAARAGFEELLRTYPDFDQASAALLYIGQSYQEEKRTAEADSVYSLLVSKYPRSEDAPTALYKWGVSQQTQGRVAEARAAFQRIQRDWPRSTEAELAAEALKSIR